MNSVVELKSGHYRVEDARAAELWRRQDPRDDELLRRLVHGWVFQDVGGDWVAMENPSGHVTRYGSKRDQAFAHFGARFQLAASSPPAK